MEGIAASGDVDRPAESLTFGAGITNINKRIAAIINANILFILPSSFNQSNICIETCL
jgi:hypothetical protein